jgi:hypothetical protein
MHSAEFSAASLAGCHHVPRTTAALQIVRLLRCGLRGPGLRLMSDYWYGDDVQNICVHWLTSGFMLCCAACMPIAALHSEHIDSSLVGGLGLEGILAVSYADGVLQV